MGGASWQFLPQARLGRNGKVAMLGSATPGTAAVCSGNSSEWGVAFVVVTVVVVCVASGGTQMP